MNGVVEITIKEQVHILRFNVHASMTFSLKTSTNPLSWDSAEGMVKFTSDLFYAGLVGQAMRDQRQIPTWDQAMDLFDEYSLEDTFNEGCASIINSFLGTEWANKFMSVSSGGSESDKKKVAKKV